MASISGTPTIFGIDPHGSGSTQLHPLGTKGVSEDGRVYRYCENGGTAQVAGNLYVAPDVVANHEDIAVNTFALGATSVTVTLGATAASENDYAEGYLCVVDETGQGKTYRIKGHPAADSAASLVVQLAEPIDVAAAAATTVTLVKNPYKDVVISDGTQTDIPVGVATEAIAADEYGWLQTGGYASVLQDAATAAGALVTIGSSTNGAIEAADAVAEPIIGQIPTGANAVDGEYNQTFLTIDRS